MDGKFRELLRIVALRKEVEKRLAEAKEEYERTVYADKEIFKNLEEQELILREECMLEMKEAEEESKEVDGFIIKRQVKRTPKVLDANVFRQQILDNKEFYKNIGIDSDAAVSVLFAEELIIKDKKAIDEIIKKVDNFNGTLPDGVGLTETEYVTITERKEGEI